MKFAPRLIFVPQCWAANFERKWYSLEHDYHDILLRCKDTILNSCFLRWPDIRLHHYSIKIL